MTAWNYKRKLKNNGITTQLMSILTFYIHTFVGLSNLLCNKH